MQQRISNGIRKNPVKREAGQQHKNIRAKSTGVTQILTDNSFLKEQFQPLSLAEIISFDKVDGLSSPQENIKNLIKAATGYLALYEKQFSFIPSGNFGYDLANLFNEFSMQLPKNQELNVDYSKNQFVFVVYQSNEDFYWRTICYIPLSIANTMRPKMKRLYIRFCAFMMQVNNIKPIYSSDDYDMIIEDIQSRKEDQEQEDEIAEEYVQMYHSYENKTGKANKLIKMVENHTIVNPNELLHQLRSIKGLTSLETEQINCMIRGTELMSSDNLTNYVYNNLYDGYTKSEMEVEYGTVGWQDSITYSWGEGSNDPIVDCHYLMLNDNWQNLEVIEPYSFTILSPDKQEKLPPCNFPFKWLDYLQDDYLKYLAINEQTNK